jgi:hypothetical protein
MFQALRKRIHVSPATAIATLALVFAMTGGAYAASKYLITSTKQISPKVLKSLKGANGKNGAAGPAGPAGAAGAGTAGAAGPQGPAGAAGPKGETGPAGTNGTNGTNGTTGFTEFLPKGKTEQGVWTASGSGVTGSGAISFVIPLESAPAAHYVNSSGQELTGTEERTPSVCTGSAVNPTAPEGTLCVYATSGRENGVSTNIGTNHFLHGEWNWGVSVDNGVTGSPDTATPFGAEVFVVSEELQHPFDVEGTWAVTA